MKLATPLSALACSLLILTPALGNPHDGDIFLTLQNNQITPGAVRAGGEIDTDVRVFQTTLGLVSANFTADPGCDSLPGTFPASSRIGFRILKSLRAWDGTSFDSVSPVPMELSFASLARLTPQTDEIVPGFELTVGSNGQWHRHYTYILQDPAPTGVYLLEMQLYSNTPDITESLPYWIVFNQNSPQETANTAAAWVVDNLATPPTSCIADFNQDGGVDGQDVEAFFIVWEQGLAEADANQDGGVDGQDVEAFFLVWEQGGC